jgi:anti-anti-sigma factor
MIQLTLDAPSARIRLLIQGPVAVLQCAGEIDAGNIRWLELPMAMAIELGARRLEIDLRDVRFFDGAVMKALCRTSWALPSGSAALWVCVQPRMEALFRRVRLDRMMTIQTSPAEENPQPNANGQHPRGIGPGPAAGMPDLSSHS